MSEDYVEPRSIEAIRAERLVQIEWDDGHRSSYEFEYLRWRCPCAECQGEGGLPGVLSFTKEFTAEQTSLASLHAVGRYAVAPVWQDGHSSGVYSYEYLRAICPCDICLYAPGHRHHEHRAGPQEQGSG